MSDPASLVASLLVSLVGFALFTYGRKQRRAPHMMSGLIMMGCTFLLDGASALLALCAALVFACWAAVRFFGL